MRKIVKKTKYSTMHELIAEDERYETDLEWIARLIEKVNSTLIQTIYQHMYDTQKVHNQNMKEIKQSITELTRGIYLLIIIFGTFLVSYWWNN